MSTLYQNNLLDITTPPKICIITPNTNIPIHNNKNQKINDEEVETFFNSSCDCMSYVTPLRPSSLTQIIDYYNQFNDEGKKAILEHFKIINAVKNGEEIEFEHIREIKDEEEN